jgi:hypothetical protein
MWALGDIWVEVVHEAAQGCFLLPAFATKLRATWGTDNGDGCGSHENSGEIAK